MGTKGNQLHIGTINARGLNNTKKRLSLSEWAKVGNLDIILIQETYCTSRFSSVFNRLWKGEIYHSHTDSKHSRGVCIMINHKFNCKVLSYHYDDKGRKLLLNFEYGDDKYTVVNLYCPTDQREREIFLNDCIGWINSKRINDSYLILGGDMNCIDSPSDRVSNMTDKSSRSLRNLKRSLCITDMWRFLHPDKCDFTYVDPSCRNYNSRIDILCVCNDLERRVVRCEHEIAPCPDHKAVVMYIELKDKPRGKGYWKLNVSVLEEKNYVDNVREIMKDTLIEYQNQAEKSLIWELVKIRIKEFSIRYCTSRVSKKVTEMKQLESSIHILDSKIQLEPHNEEYVTERKILKQTLDTLYADKAIGAQVRAKVRWVEDGEKSTSYFLAVEKYRQGNNVINCLTENKVQYFDDSDILRIAREFFSDLYTSKQPPQSEITAYLDRVNVPTLTDEESSLCEGAISNLECVSALSEMNMNKSPGEDGLPVEFYRKFWNDIGSFIVDIYNDSFTKHELPLSMRKAVIALIFKKGDKEKIENYRPISLTNTDYKILAFVLAKRLQRVISIVISPDQVAYIKGRFIGTNVRLIQDVFKLYNDRNMPGLFMFVDFKKAFDSVEWDFLFEVLRKFNIGDNFQTWIKLLYIKPCASVKNNGFLSEEFSLYRGVRQGCPVSALLFILCMEVLACRIKQNDRISGLCLDSIRDHNIKITQYADDATLFLRNAADMQEAIETLEIFGKISGTELNLAKCEGLWIGCNKNRQNNCNMHQMKWPVTPVRYLGIYIGHDEQECNRLNFQDKVDQIDEVLKQAEKRNVTLFGKVCLIKALAISKITYVATCLDVPDRTIKDIDQRLFRYLWGKRDRIKRKSAINTLQKGGLNMIDLKSHLCALKAAWACRIATAPEESLWSYLPKMYLSKLGDDFLILKTTVTEIDMLPYLKQIPKFYQDVVLSYNKSKIVTSNDFYDNVLNQPIWGNKYLKFKKKTLFFKSWIKEGILLIKNLKLVNGKLDVKFLNNVIQDKRKFHSEINILQSVFKLAKLNLSNEPSNENRIPVFLCHSEETYTWELKRSRFYYCNLIENIAIRPTSERYWNEFTNGRITDDKLLDSYNHKVKQIKDKKLSETSFKILNNILPCNRNLYKWGKSETKMCSFCQEEENISHLLYSCTYAQYIWSIVTRSLDSEKYVTHDTVIFGLGLDTPLSYLFSIVIYYIYREWLICSFEHKQRKQHFCIKSLISYLGIKQNVYAKCTNNIWIEVCFRIEALICVLKAMC